MTLLSGPLSEAIRLATFTPSQSLYHPQYAPPQSFALLTHLLALGRVANAWAAMYPFQKWSGETSSSRRLLSQAEKYSLRKACYRLWLYSTAWHNRGYGRLIRNQTMVVRQRAAMLRMWSTEELAEMQDLQNIFRTILADHVCPSNSTVLQRFKERFPSIAVGGASTLRVHSLGNVNTKLDHDSQDFPLGQRYNACRSNAIASRCPVLEGWGDEISHYYLLEDMLKLNPQQILELDRLIDANDAGSCDCQPSVAHSVECMLTQWGCSPDWFENNGETFAGTVQTVINDRGGEYELFRDAIEMGHQGIVKDPHGISGSTMSD